MNLETLKALYQIEWKIPEDLGVPRTRDDKYICPFHDDKNPSMKVYASTQKFFCFTCNEQGDVVDWLTKYHRTTVADLLREHGNVSPEEANRRRLEAVERKAKALADELAYVKQALKEMQESKIWEQYNEGMSEADRQVWEYRGVERWYQDYMRLGATVREWPVGEEHKSIKSLTIPVMSHDWQVGGIKHRLLEHDQKNKYRFFPAHVSVPLYFANPEANMDTVYLLEGEIKAMVFFITLGRNDVTVVGSPSSVLTEANANSISQASRVIYVPDPGVSSDIKNKNWKLLKEKDFYLLEFLGKPDDIINEWKPDKAEFARFIKNNTKLIRSATK